MKKTRMDVSRTQRSEYILKDWEKVIILSFLTLTAQAHTHAPNPLASWNLFPILVFPQVLSFFPCCIKSLAKFPSSLAIDETLYE